MTPKTIYVLLSFLALFSMLRLPDMALRIMGGILCIGGVYYIIDRLRKHRRLTFMLLAMCFVVVVFNPILTIYPYENAPFWMLSRLIATALFWFAARKEPLPNQ